MTEEYFVLIDDPCKCHTLKSMRGEGWFCPKCAADISPSDDSTFNFDKYLVSDLKHLP